MMIEDKHTALGTILGVLALSATASAAVVVVQQVSNSFIPANVNANPGDTIRWVRTGGTHTVTSGSDCTDDGLLDGLLSSSSTSFQWVVPASFSGTINYFCAPHCFWGMDGSGTVSGGDLAIQLANWT